MKKKNKKNPLVKGLKEIYSCLVNLVGKKTHPNGTLHESNSMR